MFAAPGLFYTLIIHLKRCNVKHKHKKRRKNLCVVRWLLSAPSFNMRERSGSHVLRRDYVRRMLCGCLAGAVQPRAAVQPCLIERLERLGVGAVRLPTFPDLTTHSDQESAPAPSYRIAETLPPGASAPRRYLLDMHPCTYLPVVRWYIFRGFSDFQI